MNKAFGNQSSFGRRAVSVADNPVIATPEPTKLDREIEDAPVEDVNDNFAQVRLQCLNLIDPAILTTLPPDRVRLEVERVIAQISATLRLQLNRAEQRQLSSDLVDDMLGLGPLQVLLDDQRVADIMVNGPEKVFIEMAGKTYPSSVRFRDRTHLSGICQRIASAVGRRVDEASPITDARLADGSRVNMVFPPLALDGPYLSIRKFAKRVIDLEQLVQLGAMTSQMSKILDLAGRCRLNIIVSGGTGSGKTTLLNAISRSAEGSERIITIEDAAELQLQQPHVVRMETRPPSMEGSGEITQRDLLRNALRMRPDRVIIGEVRSGEAFDMLQAMNTGHDGSMSTVHANSTRDALTRIENMVQMGVVGLSARAIRQQISSAVDLIIQVERQRDGKRRIVQISDIGGMEGDVIITNNIFSFVVDSSSSEASVIGSYATSRARPSFFDRIAYFGFARQWQDVMSEEA